MLKIEDLEVSYGAGQALRGISMEVNDGEIVSLIGANGAGKTTTQGQKSDRGGPRAGLCAFPAPERARQAARGHALRRRAADAGYGPRHYERAEAHRHG